MIRYEVLLIEDNGNFYFLVCFGFRFELRFVRVCCNFFFDSVWVLFLRFLEFWILGLFLYFLKFFFGFLFEILFILLLLDGVVDLFCFVLGGVCDFFDV